MVARDGKAHGPEFAGDLDGTGIEDDANRPRHGHAVLFATDVRSQLTARDDETDILVGKRSDTLVRADAGWKLARREIQLDQSVLLAKNLTLFF